MGQIKNIKLHIVTDIKIKSLYKNRNKKQIMKMLNDFNSEQSSEFSSSSQQNTTDILRDAFLEFDQNSDGFISKEELSSVMSSFGYNVSQKELDEMVKLVDADGNDLIDFHEFSSLMEGYLAVVDVDQEIRSMMKKLGEKPRKKDIQKMMKSADKNGDGKISYDEFKDMFQSGNMFACCR